MPNSTKTPGDQDRRKLNSAPEYGRIKSGEVRNKWGRAGKPVLQPPTDIDELYWSEGSRVVTHSNGEPVDAKKRLVTEEFYAALGNGDPAARARVLARLQDASVRMERPRHELIALVTERLPQIADDFYLAKKTGRRAPDILPHPDHVHLVENGVRLTGPWDLSGRDAWELIKSRITVTACIHKILRDEVRQSGSAVAREELKAIEKHRRWLMRSVPKGWKWREQIYCLGSHLPKTRKIVRFLEETGYVDPTAGD